jgi:quinol monooxygenase YgiN
MLIVAGTFTVAPKDRDAFLEGRVDSMIQARAEKGCLTYTLMADPLEDGTIRLFECWESQADLDAHIAGMQPPATGQSSPPSAPNIEVLERSILVYPVAAEGPRPL